MRFPVTAYKLERVFGLSCASGLWICIDKKRNVRLRSEPQEEANVKPYQSALEW
jgi:hypothetical protein